MSSTPNLIRTGLWQWSQGIGLERFELLRAPDQWILRGTILTLTDQAPTEARYEIICDASWHTKSADISLRTEKNDNQLRINVADGGWYENSEPNETVEDCVDIDLGWSPSTNTLPIRRLHLDIGQSSGTLIAAWLSFPDLKLQPLSQKYMRISEREYRYSSRGGAFVALISVDDEGLVLDYEGFWQRLGHAKPSSFE